MIYYDRVTLQIQSLERGLDGPALPIEVRAGNLPFMDQATGLVPPFAPTLSNPFTGFILPGAGASGINIIDSRLQNPKVHQMSLGIDVSSGGDRSFESTSCTTTAPTSSSGEPSEPVFNPVVGAPDRVVNLESSAETDYDALLVEFEPRFTGRFGFRGGIHGIGCL